jgi:hypothetical protein
VDDIYWFTAPHLTIGTGGVPAFRDLDITEARDLPNYKKSSEEGLGQDLVEILQRLD